MSGATTRMGFTEAYVAAEHFADRIRSSCERLVIAGSLRRRADDVGDIEIVAVPRIWADERCDMFGEVVGVDRVDEIDRLMDVMAMQGEVQRRLTNGRSAWGPKYKRLSFEGAPFDLFTCDAENFGLILAIRTGPAWFSHQLVTPKDRRIQQGHRPGLLPVHMRVADGWLTYRVSGERIPTPEERGFFETIGQPYIEPWNRR